ncbi:MAG: hypothetical protein KJ697_01480 [Nanoarchaeota archaeon]|nr:hypothetical protein [Nanoarchaeota archaeon]
MSNGITKSNIEEIKPIVEGLKDLTGILCEIEETKVYKSYKSGQYSGPEHYWFIPEHNMDLVEKLLQ